MFLNLLARLGSPLLTLRDRRPRTPAAILAAQERWLRRLISDLGPLPVGRQFGLDQLKRNDHATFRSSVPMTGYQDYSALFARIARGERGVCFPGRCVALAQTSGTTSDAAAGERFIPQSKGLLAHQRRGAEAALARLLPATGRTIFDGKMLMMGGSTDMKPNAHGIPSGDLSGIVVSLIPEWLWGLYEPGREVALERDWSKKVQLMVDRTRQSDLRLASGIGSWLLMFFENACKAKGVQRACEVWPNLRALIHGGHAFEPVIPQFRHHLHPDTWLMEVYPASEAFIAVGSRPWRISESAPPPLELLTDHGIVIEFAPESAGTCDPAAAVLADGIEPGKLYRILLTTPGGLIRYQIGDLALGVGPGLIRFGGRVKTRISVFGEHVEGWQLADALASACAATGAQVDHYHVAPVLPKPGETRGAHEWIVEFAVPPSDPVIFSCSIDRYLLSQVADYEAHRQVQLHPPILTAVPTGTFSAFLTAKGKLGGQHKVPQAWPDRTIAESLLSEVR